MPSNLTKQITRFFQFKRLLPLVTIFVIIFSMFHTVQPVKADVALSVSPLTWEVIGLDSNNVSVGPNNFPVGIRVCNAAGADPATGVTATFTWTSSTNSTYIYLRPGSYSMIPGPAEAAITINPGACHDFYFEVEVARDPASRGKIRPYQITVTADGGVSLSYPQAPQTRQIYVEWLVSQSRNSTTNVTLDGVNVGPGGVMTLMVGSSYTITLYGSTATNGYEQIETFINFPNTIFQVNSVTTTYTAEDTTSPDLWAGSKLYADGCNWENDPASLNYRSCLGVGKYGGTISVAYDVTIIGGSGTTDTLNTLIYDFSGSSYHYNADFSTNGRIFRIVNAGIEKAFEPKTVLPGGVSTLTFTLTNPGTSTISNLNFTDPLPLDLTVATGTLTNACNGTGTVTLAHNSPPTRDTIALSGASLGPGASCSFPVTVTAASTANGLYTNVTNNLFIGSNDTEDNATDYMQVTTLPAPPSSCALPTVLATWTIPDASGPPPNELINPLALVDFAEATAALTGVNGSGQFTNSAGVTTNAWRVTDAWTDVSTVDPVVSVAPYIQFEIDTSDYGGARLRFQYALETNGQWGANNNNWVYVYSSTDGANFSLAGWIDATKGSWQPLQTITAASTGTNHTYFRITAKTRGNQPVASVLLDNITIDGCARPSAPLLDKAFQADPITVGGNSVLRFTLHNPNTSSLTGVVFNDSLPNGLMINTPNGLSTTCSFGTSPITAAAGTSTISLSGATLAANETCTIDVSVTGLMTGSYNNLTSNITSTETGPNTTIDGYGEDDLTVIAPPIIDKSFGANAILTGDSTTLTFSIINPNTEITLTGVSFTDTLVAGLDVANASFSNVCSGSGTLTTNNNAPVQDTVVLSGASLAPRTSCTFSVTVNGTTTGLKHNMVQVNSSNGGLGNTATADLLVRDPVYQLNFLKQVGPASTGPWSSHLELNAGGDVYYRFVVENTGDQPLTYVVVTDDDVPAALNPSTCTWYHLEGSPESPVNYVDADGNPANGFQLTIPAPSAVNNMHVAYCALGPVLALSDLHTNHASADSNETTPDPDEASYFGSDPAIQVVKNISVDSGLTWVPADAVPGPYLLSGTNPLFQFEVMNTGNVTLTSIQLADTDMSLFYDDIDLTTTCTIPSMLDPGESFVCYGGLAWAAGQHQDTATAGGVYNNSTYEDTDDAHYFGSIPALTVTKTADNNNVPETGGDVTFTYVVENTGNVSVEITSLSDNVFGVLTGDGDCQVGTTLAVGASCTFDYTTSLSGNAGTTHTNVFTVHAEDSDGNDTSATDDETVTFDDVLPTVELIKTADPLTLPEPGGDFVFTLTIHNSSAEAVTITALTDDNALSAECLALVGTSLPAGGTVTCTYPVSHSEAGTYDNTALVDGGR